MSIISESLHLLNSNRNKCKAIFQKEDKSPNDIADFLISLHLVLEIGLNGMYRELVINNLQKTIDKSKITNHLDSITFIDKTIMFVCMEKYSFDSIEEANDHYSIIETLRNFSGTRNKLMHGSMIGSFEDGKSNLSVATKVLNTEHMDAQIEKFKRIINGVTYYLNNLNNCPVDKDELNKKFLDLTFIG